jgi:hypothetical protein
MSEAVDGYTAMPIKNINDSTWSDGGHAYALWSDQKNKLHKALWDLSTLVTKEFSEIAAPKIEEGFENIATWKEKELATITDKALQDFLSLELLVLKSMHSDQYWWASNTTVYDKVLYSPNMVKNALAIYKKIAAFDLMSSVAEKIHQMSADIDGQLA